MGLSDAINLSTARVLVIDDSAPFTEVIVQLLQAFGVGEVACCASAEDAQGRCELETFDLILTDAELPGMKGYAFIDWLRRAGLGGNSVAPIIMLTAHSTMQKVTQARDSGANFLIAKPIEPRILLERIRWISNDARPIIRTESYVGPDRRFRARFPNPGRRAGDNVEMSTQEANAELSQEGIDALFG